MARSGAGAVLIISLATPTLFKHFRPPHPQAEAPEASLPQQSQSVTARTRLRATVHVAKPNAQTARDEAPAKPTDVVVDRANAPQTGRASWYDFTTATASGEVMDGGGRTAVHPTLPLGSHVLVENLANRRSVVVRINDRGPVVKGRIIDVSRGAAEKLGMVDAGVAKVRVSRIKEAVADDKTTTAEAAVIEAGVAP